MKMKGLLKAMKATLSNSEAVLDPLVKQPKIVVLIPAYNEERFIGSVVIKSLHYASHVIVVNDGSSDSTEEIAEKAGAIVLNHEVNKGKGASLNTGFKKARELNPDVVALLDGDGQHRPDDIPTMVKPILEEGVDMVIGSRYLEDKSDIPGYRKLGQKTITFLTNVTSGISSSDSWSGYRAFSNRALSVIQFREGGWGVDPEFQFQAHEHELKVAEVPIVALYEEKAKRNPIPHAAKTVNAIIRMVGQHRPLLYFGVLGSTLLLIGVILGILVVERLNQVKQLATGTALISVMFSIFGIVFLSTGFTLHSVRGLLIDMLRNKDT